MIAIGPVAGRPWAHCAKWAIAGFVAFAAASSSARSQLSALRRIASGTKAAVTEDRAQTLFRVARSARDFLRAAKEYARVANDWQKGDMRLQASAALYFEGRAYFLAGRPDSALAAYERALAVMRAAPRASLGSLLGRALTPVSAADSLLTDSLVVRALRREIGAVYQSFGRADSAVAFYQSATESCIDAQHLDPSYDYDWDVRKARQDLRKGDVVPQTPTFYCGAAHIYVWAAIGSAFLDLDRPDSALAYLRHAAAEAHRDSVGGALADASRWLADRAADLFFTGPRFPNESRVRTLMAEAFTRLGQPDSALRQYRRVLAIDKPGARLLQTSDWRGLTRALLGVGDLMLARGRADSALGSFAKALETARGSGDITMEALALHRHARYYDAVGGAASRARALAYFDSASVAKALSRARAPGDENRISLAERNEAVEPEWALAYLRDPTPDTLAVASEPVTQQRALAALGALERGRARALLDFLGDSTAVRLPQPGIDMAAAGDTLTQAATRGRRAALTFMHARDTLIAWLASPDGGITVTRRPITADSLLRLIRDFRVALGVDAAAARTLAFEAGPAVPQRAGVGVGLRVEDERRELARAGRALATVVLPADLWPALLSGRELLIVPAGPLHTVPFAALPTPSGSALLGELTPLRSAPSLYVAAQLSRADGPSGARSAVARPLLVGNPSMPTVPTGDGTSRRQLPPLQGAEAEVRWLAARLNTQPFIGAAATKRAVLPRLRGSSLVHLATHGFAFSARDRARRSFIALAPEDTDSGLLSVADLLDSEVSTAADLVVLSACQTGLGDVRQSEGVLGLQRAFLAKGARGVLASLWSVSDEATQLLMQRFYGHWLDDRDGPDSAEALYRAARDVRQTAGFEHPRYWAAFQLVGGP